MFRAASIERTRAPLPLLAAFEPAPRLSLNDVLAGLAMGCAPSGVELLLDRIESATRSEGQP